MKNKSNKSEHEWHFIQTGELVQLKITSIDDILNLKNLDQKLWTALSCPVKGLEFSEETLSLLDTDKNGQVRVCEILDAIEFVKKYLKTPEIIMSEGSSIPLDALGETPFPCGHSPLDSARSVLHILEKDGAKEISLDDISVNEKLFSPAIINGDGVLSPESVDEKTALVVKDIILCTGGADDISGVKGVTREQATIFFNDLRAAKEWKDNAKNDSEKIFFLGSQTESAAASYVKVANKIDEYFLRCSLDLYNEEIAAALKKSEEETFSLGRTLCAEQFLDLPLASTNSQKTFSFDAEINPAWKNAIALFFESVVIPVFGKEKTRLSEDDWKKIKNDFAPYIEWNSARPKNSVLPLGIERVEEILNGESEPIIFEKLNEEDAHPPIALATLDLRKLLLYCRDLLELLKNFVSFENFYSRDEKAIFQCGTLYIDGRSCDMCFRVLDSAKHAAMSPLSQCYLLYCECHRPSENRTMQIAAMVSAGSRENLIVGRNGLFYDRGGKDWDATITKIVENPISIQEAFWMPYKKLLRMIQERGVKMAADAENSIGKKMAAAVENPSSLKSLNSKDKKIDVGTIAAISVAFTGLATVVGGLLSAFLGLGYWIPLGIVGIILAISLPSMFIAWSKLRQRNIAPILDASGWAVNGNVKINIPLGNFLTHIGTRPKNSTLNIYDPYKQKKFPLVRVIVVVVLLALAAVLIAKFFCNKTLQNLF